MWSRCGLVVALGAGCARLPATAPLPLDGVVVHQEPEPLTGLDIYDPPALFHLALEADRNGDPARAQAIYERLLLSFPHSNHAIAAGFNLGLLLEHSERYDAAAERYLAVALMTEPAPGDDRRTWLHAHFRLAVCAGKLGTWWRAVAAFDEVLALKWIDDGDRLEASVGRGIALQEAGDVEAAELAFSQALWIHRKVSAESRFDDHGLAAEAAFRMGDIADAKYRAVVLAYPLDTLRQRLEQKCDLLLQAQSRYLRAIQYGDAHTVAAAGLRVGQLYESLYDMIANLAVPVDLDHEQAEVYVEEVKHRIAILLDKALMVYERSLVVGRRAPSAAEWVARLEAAVARVRTMVAR